MALELRNLTGIGLLEDEPHFVVERLIALRRLVKRFHQRDQSLHYELPGRLPASFFMPGKQKWKLGISYFSKD
jgi:hypothetical protein